MAVPVEIDRVADTPGRDRRRVPGLLSQVELHSIVAVKFCSGFNHLGVGGSLEKFSPPGAQSGWTRALLPVRTSRGGQKAP